MPPDPPWTRPPSQAAWVGFGHLARQSTSQELQHVLLRSFTGVLSWGQGLRDGPWGGCTNTHTHTRTDSETKGTSSCDPSGVLSWGHRLRDGPWGGCTKHTPTHAPTARPRALLRVIPHGGTKLGTPAQRWAMGWFYRTHARTHRQRDEGQKQDSADSLMAAQTQSVSPWRVRQCLQLKASPLDRKGDTYL